MSLNVDGSNDAFYRYKMPKLNVKVEGKGNGIKTVLCNINEIGKAVGRKPEYPTKFFAMELGAQSIIDKKADRYIVNGAHEAKYLQDMMTAFIQKFVLCESCCNPETVLSVKKQGKNASVMYRCKACGSSGELSTRHKLISYICKNPPEKEVEIVANVSKDDNAEATDSGEGGDHPNENGENEINTSTIDIEVPPPVDEIKEEDVKWTVDESEDATRKRMMELNDAAKRLAVTETNYANSLSEEERAHLFYAKIDGMVNTMTTPRPVFIKLQIQELLKESARLNLQTKAILCIMDKLFNNPNTIAEDVEANKLLLAAFCRDEKSETYLINGIYALIDKYYEKLLTQTAPLLNLFYRHDILSEESILMWHEKPANARRMVGKSRSQKILDQAKPFINFLKTADSESEEESEDEENEASDKEVSDNASPMKESSHEDLSDVKESSACANVSESDEDEEVDIDNI